QARGTADTLVNSDTLSTASLQELLARSEISRIRDSIRSALLYEELRRMKNPSEVRQQAMLQEILLLKQQDSLRLDKQMRAVEALRAQTEGVPVLLHQDT